KPVQVGERDVALRQVALQVLVQVVGEVDDDREDGKPDSRHQEDAPELAEYISVERPEDAAERSDGHARQAVAPGSRAVRLRLANQSRTASTRSCQSPLLAVDASRPMRAMSTSPTEVKMMLAPHMARNGGMLPRSASDSPPMSPM